MLQTSFKLHCYDCRKGCLLQLSAEVCFFGGRRLRLTVSCTAAFIKTERTQLSSRSLLLRDATFVLWQMVMTFLTSVSEHQRENSSINTFKWHRNLYSDSVPQVPVIWKLVPYWYSVSVPSPNQDSFLSFTFHLQEYIHRVGRTARGINGRGHALLILRPEELGFLRFLKQAKVTISNSAVLIQNRAQHNIIPSFPLLYHVFKWDWLLLTWVLCFPGSTE